MSAKKSEIKKLVKKFKIKKDDMVHVITGKDKGKRGKVLEVLRDINKLIVENINTCSKHVKASQTSSGGIIKKFLPIHISNVAHIDSVDDKPTRVKFVIGDDGKKVRTSVRSNNII